MVEDLREASFRDRYFEIAEIPTGIENACEKNDDRRFPLNPSATAKADY